MPSSSRAIALRRPEKPHPKKAPQSREQKQQSTGPVLKNLTFEQPKARKRHSSTNSSRAFHGSDSETTPENSHLSRFGAEKTLLKRLTFSDNRANRRISTIEPQSPPENPHLSGSRHPSGVLRPAFAPPHRSRKSSPQLMKPPKTLDFGIHVPKKLTLGFRFVP